MHAAALILALLLGAVGLVALLGISLHAHRQVRRGLSAEQRRNGNRLIAAGLLLWVAAALLVNGAGRESGEDAVARPMLVVAGLLFMALAVTAALWLRKTLRSLRSRAGSGGSHVSEGERRSRLSRVHATLGRLPPTLRAYALLQLLTVLGIPLAVVGRLSDEEALLLAGLGLAGLSVLATALGLPIIAARHRRPGA